MAEFREVMRQWVRMCGAHNNCSACRMQKENLPYTLCSEGGIQSVENIADVELAIMSWAAEHPEPVYPTWEQAIAEIYLRSGRTKYRSITEWEINDPIPADIAQKLGIEPKEG